jgi:DNA-binding NarL/FixJ family response regulator
MTGGSLEVPVAPLNERALRFLAAIAEGCTNGEISHLHGLPVQTVKNCIGEILRDLGVPNRTAAVTLALQLQMIELDSLRVRRTR